MKVTVAGLLIAALAMPAAAAEWQVDYDQSHIYFEGEQTGSPFKGEFHDFKADITFDPNALNQSEAEVTVDLESAETGDRQRDNALPNDTWFDVADHPTARFVTTGFRHLEGDRYAADAELTIKGTTQEITLPFNLSIEGDTAKVDGTVMLDRFDFDVGTGDFSGGDWVPPEVKVTVDLVATRAAP